ncbi:hypothetical protein FGG08_005064 [Glutinoglossum americanum]|uniref:Uncharacterized protein n=1 Tax=Glutinoglossum americanum TaxID=1670608 RepID=A0A9P8I7X5_9PEZI|nr:hypothetical protein FGG08_005064 [Glutinoglossum americanum]
MGFWRNLDRSIDQFLEFRPDVYRAEISGLREDQLRELHKRIQRKLVGAGTQTAIGIGAAVPSGGLSLIGSLVGGRRISVNKQRCDVIETLLREKGWSGHDFRPKDFLLGAAPGALALVLAPGADHVADHAISHITTATAHHGADQVANYASVPVVHHGAGTAFGISAAHHGAEAAVKLGANYALNGRSGATAAQKASSRQKAPAPPAMLKHSVTKPSATGPGMHKKPPSRKHTTAPAPRAGGFIQTVARIALILLPSIMFSTLGQEPLWIASALTVAVIAALKFADRALSIFLIIPSIIYYFTGVQALWWISMASVIVDVLNQHSLDWHYKLLRVVKVMIYILMGIFVATGNVDLEKFKWVNGCVFYDFETYGADVGCWKDEVARTQGEHHAGSPGSSFKAAPTGEL